MLNPSVDPDSSIASARAAGRRPGTGPYLQEVSGTGSPHTPVWFMRQAGRSLPEYRELRVGTTMIEACFDPDMTCEITLQPVRRHGVDAAILFSDIVPGTGPVVARPIRSEADVDALPELTPDRVEKIQEAVRLIVAELDPATALIGFAGQLR